MLPKSRRDVVVLGLSAAVFAVAVALLAARARVSSMMDLGVYRDGVLALLHGKDVYATGFGPGHRYAYTYPPASLLAFLPLAAVGFQVARVVMLCLSLAALVVAADAMLARTRLGRTQRWAAALGLSGAALALEPVRETFFLGQVNLLLLALVLPDVLAERTRLPRGVLVGVATAIKLTPGIFIVYLALTGRRRAAGTAVATAAGATAVTFVVAPGQSWRYWTHDVLDPERPGNAHYVANQSLRGVLARTLGIEHPTALLWLAPAALAACGGLYLAVRAHRRGDLLLGVGLCGVAGLLFSPISWNHHWVYALPVGVALFGRLARHVEHTWRTRCTRGRRAALLWAFLSAGWALVFVLGPVWWVRDLTPLGLTELRPTEMVSSNAYVLAGVALLLVLALTDRRDERTRERGHRLNGTTPRNGPAEHSRTHRCSSAQNKTLSGAVHSPRSALN